MSLGAYVIRRLVLIVFVLLAVSVVTFALLQVIPGDVALMILGTEATVEDLETLRRQLGLDRPAVERYYEWLSNAVRGDFGVSLRMDMPVTPLLIERLTNSLRLAVLALCVAAPTAITLGVIAALRRESVLDWGISVFSLLGIAVPEFVWGSLFIHVLAFTWPIFPPSSLIDPDLRFMEALPYLILPTATLVVVMLAYTSRMTRSAMSDVLQSNYIRTARLKGLTEREVVFKHALRNALPASITIIAMSAGWLIGSLVVVETVFAYPGMGRLVVFAVSNRDVPVLQATMLVIAGMYALANLAGDLISAWLTPRIRG